MTDTSNWSCFYKLIENGEKFTTNMMYTPLINPEKTVMCMLWDENSDYLKNNDNEITSDLIDFFFDREIKYLDLFQKYSWAPKIYEIDREKKKIFIEWNSRTINHTLYGFKKNLNDICPNWKEQIFQILQDVKQAGYYKLALYPHCFYINDEDKIKTFDFYSCVSIEERYIPRSKLEGMIGKNSNDRFNLSTVDGNIDFKIFFEITMKRQLSNYWPDNPFPEFYEKLK